MKSTADLRKWTEPSLLLHDANLAQTAAPCANSPPVANISLPKNEDKFCGTTQTPSPIPYLFALWDLELVK